MQRGIEGMTIGLLALAFLSGCGEQSQPAASTNQASPAAPSTAQTTAPVSEPAVQPSGPANQPASVAPASSASPVSEVLRFIPERATAVLIKNHRALREFSVPFFLNPGSGFDGRLGGNFSDREIDLSALALLGGRPPGTYDYGREDWQFVGCLQLAPGATVQRLVNAWQLQRDDKTYPGFTCYRSAEPALPHFIVQRRATLAIGAHEVLKPRLAANAPQGPIERRLTPLAADHDILVCCLTDHRELSLAEGYLQPLVTVLEPLLADLKSLPPGAYSALIVALRLRGEPQLLVRVEAADESLAAEMEGLFGRCLERVQLTFAEVRDDLKRELPADSAADIDQFLAEAARDLQVRRSGQDLDVIAPLGKDGAALKRFIELVQRRQGHQFRDALYAAREAVKRRDPREQLKQIGIAFHNYHDVHSTFPPPAIRDREKRPLLSWRVALLPLLGALEPDGNKGNLYEQFKLDEPWDSDHNRPLLKKMPSIYRDLRVMDPTLTTLQIFVGEGAAFSTEPFSFHKILDGTSNTVLAVQAPPDRAVPWTKPEDLPFDLADPKIAFGKQHSTTVLAVMFDGKVQTFPADLPSDTWRWLIQADDGHVLELPRRLEN